MQKTLPTLLEQRKQREALALRTNLLKRKLQHKARDLKSLSSAQRNKKDKI